MIDRRRPFSPGSKQRHSRNQCHSILLNDGSLGREQIDIGNVMFLAICRIACRGGRNHGDAALHLGGRGAIKGRETNPGGLAFPYLVYVGRRDPDLEFEFCLLRNDRRNLCCRRNDATHRMNKQLVDVARNRRSDFGARQTVLDRQFAFAQFGNARVHRPEIALRFGTRVLVSTGQMPVSARTMVVFPPALGPMMPRAWPASSSKATSLRMIRLL